KDLPAVLGQVERAADRLAAARWRNPGVRHEAAQVHIAARWRGGRVAARGARATAPSDTADRCSESSLPAVQAGKGGKDTGHGLTAAGSATSRRRMIDNIRRPRASARSWTKYVGGWLLP